MRIKKTSLMAACAWSVLTLPVAGQQSFRSYQKLSGRVLTSVGQTPATPTPQQRNMPLRFQGWNHPERFGPDYVKAQTAIIKDFVKNNLTKAERNKIIYVNQ